MTDDAIAHYKTAVGHYAAGEFEAAVEAYGRALEARPDWAEVILGMAMAQMQAGKLDDAIATAERAAKIDPDDPNVYTSLSMFWVRKGDIDEAERQQAKARMAAWKQELKENPDAPPPADGGMSVMQ